MQPNVSLIVIGAGSGGMAAARRAARYLPEGSVVVVERTRLGGTCVNVGCVPKKVMVNAVHVQQTIDDSFGYGFNLPENSSIPKLHYPELKKRRDAYVKRLNGIYEANLERDKINIIRGDAKFISNHEIKVGDKTYSAPHIIIATGGEPTRPKDTPGVEFGFTSNEFFDVMPEIPKSVAVVGAGYIAVELAGVLAGLGAETHLICRNPTFLREFDSETIAVLRKEMENHVKIHHSTTTKKVEKVGEKLQMTDAKDNVICIVDSLIWAIGRAPMIDLLNLQETDIKFDSNTKRITVDEFQNTSVKGVYALGDVCGNIELTPVAIAAGRALAERLFNNKPDSKFDYTNVPTVIFSHPPLGTIGLSEEKAKQTYGEENIKVFKSTFINMYFSLLDENRKQKTFMKMITCGPEEKVIGLHLLGLGCDEMLQGFGVAIKMGATRKDFQSCCAIHPTGSEEVVLL